MLQFDFLRIDRVSVYNSIERLFPLRSIRSIDLWSVCFRCVPWLTVRNNFISNTVCTCSSVLNSILIQWTSSRSRFCVVHEFFFCQKNLTVVNVLSSQIIGMHGFVRFRRTKVIIIPWYSLPFLYTPKLATQFSLSLWSFFLCFMF